MIVAFCGKMGSGKTSTALELERLFQKHQYKVLMKNFADSLKEMISNHLGIPLQMFYSQQGKNFTLQTFDNNETVGTLMQKWGEALRIVHKDIFVMSMEKYCQSHVLIVGDVRYQNEFDWLLLKKAFLIRLKGDPGNVVGQSSRSLDHESEIQLDHLTSEDFFLDLKTDEGKSAAEIALQIFNAIMLVN